MKKAADRCSLISTAAPDPSFSYISLSFKGKEHFGVCIRFLLHTGTLSLSQLPILGSPSMQAYLGSQQIKQPFWVQNKELSSGSASRGNQVTRVDNLRITTVI